LEIYLPTYDHPGKRIDVRFGSFTSLSPLLPTVAARLKAGGGPVVGHGDAIPCGREILPRRSVEPVDEGVRDRSPS